VYLALIAFWVLRSKLLKSNTSKPHILEEWWVLAMFFSPMAAIAMSQTLRADWVLREYDSPARFLLAIPIFLAVSRNWVQSSRRSMTFLWIQYAIPLALIAMLISVLTLPSKVWGSRLATYFADPLTFGSYALLFALTSLYGLVLCLQSQHKKPLIMILGIVGFVIGLFLSISSGSRTAWLSFPIISVWLAIRFLIPRLGVALTGILFLVGVTIFIVLVGYLFPDFEGHFIEGLDELLTYKLNEMNPDKSVMMRLSFYRFAWGYFMQHPLTGWGTYGWESAMNSPDFQIFASEYTRKFTVAGFHNEMMTEMVRSGVWGLVSRFLLFIVPFGVAYRLRGSYSTTSPQIYFFICLLMVHQLCMSFTTEITGLIYRTSFLALLLAVSLGELVYYKRASLELKAM